MSTYRKSDKKIPVVIVEAHNHALEHIHDVLRRNKLLDCTYSMLHFDSHADLSVPCNAPAAACFRPRQYFINNNHDEIPQENNVDEKEEEQDNEKTLYELLDSTSSGIAEWILPLVLATNLNHVYWIRPGISNISEQIPDGTHRFHVGAWTSEDHSPVRSFLDLPMSATVKVDFDNVYYHDDDSYAPSSELLLAKPLNLTVAPGIILQANMSEKFILDICLDFFACCNPFVSDIQKHNDAFAKALLEAVAPATICKSGGPNASFLLCEFRNMLKKILLSLKDEMILFSVPNSIPEDTRKLLTFYESTEHGISTIQKMLEILARQSDDERKLLIDLATEFLPNLTMPHSIHHDAVNQRIHVLHEYLHEIPNDPFIITIARSSNDGFTPASLVENLQETVLKEVHNRYCGCSRVEFSPTFVLNDSCCRLHIVFDYGASEGSIIFK
jgi:hypothetical protein